MTDPLYQRAVAFLLVFALAGCVQDAPGPQTTDADPVAFDDSTGAVEGLVTDDSLNPVPAAKVHLDEATFTETAADGRFTFSHVQPGTYTVQVLAVGYVTAAQRIDVAAGSAASARLIMTPLAVKEPHVLTASKAGEVMCSGYVRVANGLPGALGLCVVVDSRFKTQWRWSDMDGLGGMWLETTWRSTQLAGNGLELYVPFGVGTTYYAYLARNLVGSNPIRHNVTGEAMDQFLKDKKVGEGLGACPTKECVMEVWHYVYGHLLGPGSSVDAGLLLQQRYDDYVSLFYHSDLPQDFTALPDS